MKVKPNKRFNKRHLFVIGIIVLLVAAIQILPYTLIFNNKVETTNYEECVELPAKTECKNEKDFVAYTVNKEHTEIQKITRDNIKTCYDYYTNPVYEERLPAVLALLAFLLRNLSGFMIKCRNCWTCQFFPRSFRCVVKRCFLIR